MGNGAVSNWCKVEAFSENEAAEKVCGAALSEAGKLAQLRARRHSGIPDHVQERAADVESPLRPEANRAAVTPFTTMPTAATIMTVPLATGSG